MEYGPTTTPTFESPNVGGGAEKKPDKKDKKKTSFDSRPLQQQKVEHDLAKSLDKFSLFEKPPVTKTKAETLDAKLSITMDELQAPEASSEQAAPSEALSQLETNRLNQELAQAHLQDWEASEPLTNELHEPQPVADFLGLVAEGQDVEASFAVAASKLGVSAEELQAFQAETQDDEPPADDEELPPPAEFIDQDQSEITIAHEDDAAATADPSQGGGSHGSSGSSGSGSGAGSGGNNNGGPIPPAGAGGQSPPGPNNPNNYGASQAAFNPNMVPLATARYHERRAQTNGLLVGGLLGYLIGRRRGRIKTEKRLMPVQRKLTREVQRLDRDLLSKELLLRKLQAEKINQRAANQQLTNHEMSRMVAPERQANPLPERAQVGRPETRLGLQKPRPAERLGHLLVAAETPKAEVRLQRPNSIREGFRAEEVKQMNRRELLELSEKIIIEGASLRHIYDSNLIGEKQLRHLIGEYLQGKDIRRALRKEMVEREIDFERDPILRDRVRSTRATSNATLDEMLAKVGASPDDDSQDARRAQAAADKATSKLAQQKRSRQLADSGMLSLIVILAIVIAILLLRH